MKPLCYFLIGLCLLPTLLLAVDCPNIAISTVNETCAGNSDGSATISVGGNPSAYTYTWLPNVSTSTTASNLAAGNYSVTVSGTIAGTGTGTTTLFSDNFNSGTSNWTLNTGGGSNQWSVDANYAGSDCNFLGTPLFTVPDVPAQPLAVSGSPYSNYLHIRATNAGSGFCDQPWPPTNANYDAGQNSNQCAEMLMPISTSGLSNIALKFYWLCVGGPNSYGYVQYSTGSGWTSIGGNFNNSGTWQEATISNAAFENQSNLRYRFCWTNGSDGNDPPFSIDEVHVVSTSSSTPCSSVFNFTIAAGTAVNATFSGLAASYCHGDLAVSLSPATLGGTFSGQTIVGNTFNPRFATTLNAPIPITYTVTQNGCTASYTQNVTVIPQPDASFNPILAATYYPSDPAIALTPLVAGGTWSGGCLVSNVFIPSMATLNVPCNIGYTLTQNGCTSTLVQSVMVVSPPINVKLNVLLQGAYSTTNNAMRNDLQIGAWLPLAQPYAVAPFNYAGTESLNNIANFPANTVDWVLIELRDALNPNTILGRKAALLLTNGNVVDTNGNMGVNFNIASGNYYVVVRHRSHLAVMSAAAVSLPNATAYDFTTAAAQSYGNNQSIEVAANKWAMYSGDIDAQGVITSGDYSQYSTQIISGNVSNGYYSADANLDGNVNMLDFSLYRPNAKIIGLPVLRY